MFQFYTFKKFYFFLSVIFFLAFSFILWGSKSYEAQSYFHNFLGVVMASDEQPGKVFRVKEILDGQWNQQNIEISFQKGAPGIPVVAVDKYSYPPIPKNPEAIKMILAFQLSPGKTRKDFAEFKKIDAPWVISNNGSNPATIWTQRTGNWIFDGFEDVVFASKNDFKRAYAGNDTLIKAGEGLFGEKVLVVIVELN